MTLARHVSRDLHLIREANPGDLAQRRVRLLRSGRRNAGAYTAPLRRPLQRRRRRLLFLYFALFAHELIRSRHACAFLSFVRGESPTTKSRAAAQGLAPKAVARP